MEILPCTYTPTHIHTQKMNIKVTHTQNFYRPPEGGQLHDMKVSSVYEFLCICYLIKILDP